MKITSYGATRTTTGSKHLLEVSDKKILLDCGLFEGKREESFQRNRNFDFDPKSLTALILSHAHIDHTGNSPTLCSRGFDGNIYSTFATRDLCGIMLQDSAKVQASDLAFVNKKRTKHGIPPLEPLYDFAAAEACLKQFVALNYHRPFPVCDGVIAKFIDAGHILGSSQVLLDLKEHRRKLRFLFSGDIGRGNNDILRDPDPSEKIDVLMVESTYGGRQHSDLQTSKEDLCRIVHETIARRGKLLIPSFAVGRAQQLVYMLHQLREAELIPKIPIYVDSPLTVNATEIFRLHPECYNEKIHDFLNTKRNPFGWEEITYIRELTRSMELNQVHDPVIIISASGMCEAGRILHHLRNSIEDEKNTVLFVGHCAALTLGARLIQGEKKVNIFGEPFHVRAKIERLDAFSGHADHDELLAYIRRVKGPKKKILIVHGECQYSEALQAALREEYPKSEIIISEYGVPIEL